MANGNESLFSNGFEALQIPDEVSPIIGPEGLA
jgi:hypothetical protein